MKRCFLFMAFLPFLTSCLSTAYIPNAVNAPLFTDKNQGSFALGLQLQEYPNAQIQTAYSFHKNWAVQANAALMTYIEAEHNAFGELALGYFFKPVAAEPNFVLECFGGYGYGFNQGSFRYRTYDETSHNHRIYIQPSAGYAHQIIDVSMSLRMGFIYSDIRSNLMNTNYSTNNIFVEPVTTFKVGYKYLRFVTQIGLSMPFKNIYEEDDWQFMIFNMGFQGQIRNFTSDKNKTPKPL